MQKEVSIHRIIILFLVVMFFISCKKNELDIPIVSFIKPTENSYFVVGDTIPVSFDVSSISPIQTIQITLVDHNLIPIIKNYVVSQLNGKRSGRVDFAIILDDFFMLAGNYEVKVHVENEKEVKDKYQKIIISSQNRELLGVAVVTKQPNSINVWNYNLLFHKTLMKSMIGDYGGSVYMPFHNRFALSSRLQGNFTIWNYLTGDTVFHEAAMANPPFPYYTGTASINQNITIQYYAGAFSLLDYKGRTVNAINTTTGFYPVNIFDIGDNFISIEQRKGTTQKSLVSHLGSTGMSYAYYILQGPVIKAFPFEGKDFMMFSNYNATGQIECYHWEHNATTRPVPYSGDEFVDVAQISPKEYLLLTSSEVLWYRYTNSSITSMISLSVTNPIKIYFEALSQTIWIVDKQGFKIYSYPSGNLKADQRVNEEVLNLHLIYNY